MLKHFLGAAFDATVIALEKKNPKQMKVHILIIRQPIPIQPISPGLRNHSKIFVWSG